MEVCNSQIDLHGCTKGNSFMYNANTASFDIKDSKFSWMKTDFVIVM
jgi:hypothetical protein